jgi:hypothetical protein
MPAQLGEGGDEAAGSSFGSQAQRRVVIAGEGDRCPIRHDDEAAPGAEQLA